MTTCDGQLFLWFSARGHVNFSFLLFALRALNSQFVNFILEHVVPLAPHLRPNIIRVDDLVSAHLVQVIASLYLDNYGLDNTNSVSHKKYKVS